MNARFALVAAACAVACHVGPPPDAPATPPADDITEVTTEDSGRKPVSCLDWCHRLSDLGCHEGELGQCVPFCEKKRETPQMAFDMGCPFRYGSPTDVRAHCHTRCLP